MIASIYHEDGRVETIPVRAHYTFAKDILRAIIELDQSVYRAQLVDQDFERTAWDSYAQVESPPVGHIVYAGATP